MRIYTCVFEKGGAAEMKSLTAPWDKGPAVEAAKAELGLGDGDRLIAMIPGQHEFRSWVIDKYSLHSVMAKQPFESKPRHSGISLKDYVPNGF